jgi:hypothetical protein
MKTFYTFLFAIVTSIQAYAQISNEWLKKSDSIFINLIARSDNELIDGKANYAFKHLLNERKTINFCNEIDTTKADLILISEYYNIKTGEVDFYERLLNFPDSVKFQRVKSSFNGMWELNSLAEYEIKELQWNFAQVDTIFPRDYCYQGGCVPNRLKKIKVERWHKKLKRSGLNKEDYYIIESWIDKKHQLINLSFRIPVCHERFLDASFGDTGKMKKPKLKLWYWRNKKEKTNSW